jgi:hypothetical protein
MAASPPRLLSKRDSIQRDIPQRINVLAMVSDEFAWRI